MLTCKCFALHKLAEFQSYEEAYHKVHSLCSSLWYGALSSHRPLFYMAAPELKVKVKTIL